MFLLHGLLSLIIGALKSVLAAFVFKNSKDYIWLVKVCLCAKTVPFDSCFFF